MNPWMQIPGVNETIENREPEWYSRIMDYSYKDVRDDLSSGLGWVAEKATGNETVGDVVEFGSQVVLPDITDVKAGGIPVGAIPRVAKKLRKIDLKTADRLIDWTLDRANSIFNKGNPNWRLAGANNAPVDDLNKTVFFSKGDDATGGISKKGFNPNITKKNLELFNEIGWTDTAKLDIQDMLYGISADGKPIMSQYKRRVLKAGIGDETFNWSAFTKNRDVVVKDFLDGLQDLKIDPKTIHGHHISALRITSSLFDGLSPIQRKKLIKTFQKHGLQLGNHPDNLMALHKSTHLDVVHPFLEKQIGKYGQLLMDPAKIKKLNPRQREKLVEKFAKIIKKSEEIALNDTRKWLDNEFLNMSPEAAFRAKMDMLDQAFDNEVALRELLLANIKQPRVFSKDVKFARKMKQVQKQLLKGDINSAKQLSVWDIDEKSLDIWSSLLKSQPEVAKEIMKKFNFDPKQLELNFDLPPRQLDLDL